MLLKEILELSEVVSLVKSGRKHVNTADNKKVPTFTNSAISREPTINNIPASAGPMIKAPECTKLSSALNRLRECSGNSKVMYVKDAGSNIALAI